MTAKGMHIENNLVFTSLPIILIISILQIFAFLLRSFVFSHRYLEMQQQIADVTYNAPVPCNNFRYINKLSDKLKQ